MRAAGSIAKWVAVGGLHLEDSVAWENYFMKITKNMREIKYQVLERPGRP